jgi:Rrf2 family protein
MIYSKTCEYAIRALSYLASKNGQGFAMIPEISRETGVPKPYIAKIFQCLVRTGILESQRGPSGGFVFKRRPETVSLLEIVEAIDDVSPLMRECVMGLDRCSARNACPLHFAWSKAKENILETLKNATLKPMTKKITKLRFRKLKRSRLQMTLALRSAA